MKQKKKACIFSLSYHGREIYRKYKNSKDFELICFLDNDPSKSGGSWGTLPIYHPSDISLVQYDIILLAGHYANLQEKQLVEDLCVDPSLLHKIKRFDLVPEPNLLKERSNETKRLLTFFLNFVKKHQIDYWMDASALLSLKRGQDLAVLSDVDILIRTEDAKRLYYGMREVPDCRVEMKTDETKSANLDHMQPSRPSQLSHAYQVAMLSTRSDELVLEPANIDIRDKHFLSDKIVWNHDGQTYFNSIRYFKGYETFIYDNNELRLPLSSDDYLVELYGDDWHKPKSFWSGNFNCQKISSPVK